MNFKTFIVALCLVFAPTVAKVAQVTNVSAETRFNAKSDTRSGMPFMDDDLVIARIDPANPSLERDWDYLECVGAYGSRRRLPGGEALSQRDLLPPRLRFGIVPDPLGSGRPVMQFTLNRADPMTGEAHRCELAAFKAPRNVLPVRTRIIAGWRILAHDASSMSARDDQLIAQWGVRGMTGYSPFLAMYIRQGRLRLEVRSDAFPGPVPRNVMRTVVWEASANSPREWVTYVIEARLSPTIEGRPFVRLWQDGRLLAERDIEIGYGNSGMHAAKIGLYHWTNANNVWDETKVERNVWFSGAIVLKDDAYRYSEVDIRQALTAQ